MGVVEGGWGPRVMVWRGGGQVLAEQAWVLGDRGPLADVRGGTQGPCPPGVRTDTAEGRRLRVWDQGCGFGSQLNHVGAVRLWASHFLSLSFLI